MMPSDDPEARAACRAAVTAALLNLVGVSMSLVAWRKLPGVLIHWLQALSLVASAMVLVALVVRRKRPTVTLGSIAFLINSAPIAPMLWVAQAGWAALGGLFVPFQPHKLGALTVALLAPPRLWVGGLGITMFVGGSLLQLGTMPAVLKANMVRGEPFATLAYGAFAVGLLIHRVRRAQLERAMMEAQVEAAARERFTRKLLVIRDLANTPIQTLELTSALLRSQHPTTANLADRMDNALARRRARTRLLHAREPPPPPAPDEASPTKPR